MTRAFVARCRRAGSAGALAVAVLAAAAGCGTGGSADGAPVGSAAVGSENATPAGTVEGAHGGAHSTTTSAPATALRIGERFQTVGYAGDYVPSAKDGGTDDYHCSLLDPQLTRDAFVTGFDVLPGVAGQVHHVILYRVSPEQASAAEQVNAENGGQGWTCFGGTGLERMGQRLEDAPWVGAWAPGGTERLLADDLGTPLPKGSKLIMQVHYNLLAGAKPDATTMKLRLSENPALKPLETRLYPAPVELPCRTGTSGPLCDRTAAVADVQKRFGANSGRLVAGLLAICSGGVTPHPGATQTCTREVWQKGVVRSAAGHMHLLGQKITVTLNQGKPGEKVLLDIPVWDFDDQGSIPVDPTPVAPGDTVTVACTHDQSMRDKLPSLKGIPERYVVWGEGTTDEMCLGILGVTRS